MFMASIPQEQVGLERWGEMQVTGEKQQSANHQN